MSSVRPFGSVRKRRRPGARAARKAPGGRAREKPSPAWRRGSIEALLRWWRGGGEGDAGLPSASPSVEGANLQPRTPRRRNSAAGSALAVVPPVCEAGAMAVAQNNVARTPSYETGMKQGMNQGYETGV